MLHTIYTPSIATHNRYQYSNTHPGVPHADSLGSSLQVFFANPKSAIFMSESSVSVCVETEIEEIP
jgi:hypothetical protein